MSRNIVLHPDGVSVGASDVVQVSKIFKPADPLRPLVTVDLSAVSESTNMLFKLRESPDGGLTWNDVGDQSEVSVTSKDLTAGTKEVTTVTCPAAGGTAQGDYFVLEDAAGTKYAVWLDVDAAGTAPTGATYSGADEQIEVDIATGDDAADVAVKVVAAIGSLMTYVDIVDNEDGTIEFSQAVSGATTDCAEYEADGTADGEFAVSVDTAGAAGNVDPDTDVFTISTHGFSDGQRVYVSGAGLPSGLSAGIYYIKYLTANTFQLSSSPGGTAVNVTDYGYGTCKVYPARYEIRMIVEDATDAAQLPLQENCIVACSSGASDSCTVSAVYTKD